MGAGFFFARPYIEPGCFYCWRPMLRSNGPFLDSLCTGSIPWLTLPCLPLCRLSFGYGGTAKKSHGRQFDDYGKVPRSAGVPRHPHYIPHMSGISNAVPVQLALSTAIRPCNWALPLGTA